MIKLIPVVALLFSGAAIAANSSAISSPVGNVTQVASQSLLSSDMPMPQAMVGVHADSCPVTSLEALTMYTDTDASGGLHSDSWSSGLGVKMPAPWDPSLKACRQSQRLKIRTAEIGLARAKNAEDRDSLEMELRTFEFCRAVEDSGRRLDNLHPMAGKCSSYVNVKMMSAFQK